MAHHNTKQLFVKIDKALGKFKEPTVLLIDNYNLLANGSDTSNSALDLVEVFNEVLFKA